MEFRVKLYLYHFFLDYRKMCFVYIKKDTKTVKDLISYISKYFEIDREFYLTSNDHYLPHFEDIRVLNADDVVVVVPQAPNVAIKEVASVKPKKIKKKKAPEPLMNTKKVAHEEFSGHDEVTVKKRIIEEDLQMMVDVLDLDEVDRGKEKRTKKKTEKVVNETWKNLAREYTRKRKINPLPISTSPNIVKTIVVHNGLASNKESDVSSDSDTSSDSTKNNDLNAKTEAIISQTDSETVKVKHKRKRVRRKRKQVHNMPLPKIEVPIIPIVGLPSTHIRFDDDINIQVEQPSAGTVSVQQPEEVIELEEYKPKDKVDYEVLCKSEVVNFPLMKDRLPNPDDVVAFKRYKLSEAFTPEISNYIIGRILNFSHDSKAVHVKILEGYEECKEPEGKLFLQLDEEPNVSDEIQFIWTELIEPRLLFP